MKGQPIEALKKDIIKCIDVWNEQPENENLQVSRTLLKETYLKWPEDQLWSLSQADCTALLKLDGQTLRVHLAAHPSDISESDLMKTVDHLKSMGRSKGMTEMVFGGGEKHIFPGVPFDSSAEIWLKAFSSAGMLVSDFAGTLKQLGTADSAKIPASPGVLREVKTDHEQLELLSFVEKEFPGRWHREIKEDMGLGFIKKNYFGYFLQASATLAGYVRLYGWNKEYWGPGIYFIGPEKGGGGLGPIGVAKSLRGQGIGQGILEQSWKILKAKGCATVRVDWTNEFEFYKRQGLKEVQRYRYAKISI